MQLKGTPFHNVVAFIVYRSHDKLRAFFMQALVTGNLIIIWLALFYRSSHCCLVKRNWMKIQYMYDRMHHFCFPAGSM